MNIIRKTALPLLAASVLLSACYEDKGNYDYISEDEAMPVQIEALEDLSAKANEVLTLEPRLTNADGGDYSYMWYAISNNYPYDCDTLSTERVLSVPLALKVGKYKLYYRVTNNQNGVYRATNANLTVTATDVTSGWYVMKAKPEGTDFDYFSLSGKSDKQDFLVSVLGDEPMKGTPVGINYQAEYYGHEYTNPDGTTTTESNLTALHLISSEDYRALEGSDLSVLMRLDDAFYEKPEKINLQYFCDDGLDYHFLLNDGDLHSLGSIGKFGYKKAGNFNLFPFIFNGRYDDIIYDQRTHNFYDAGGFADMAPCLGSDYMEFTEFADSAFTMRQFLMHTNTGFSGSAYCIVTSGNTGKHYLTSFDLVLWGSMAIIRNIKYLELAADSPLMQASVMAAPLSASVIYYVSGNKLCMCRAATGDLREIKTFGTDETISYIKNFQGTEADGTSFDDIVVITNTADKYNVYRFPLNGSAGELHTDRQPTMTGTGKASYVYFRQE